MSFALKTALTAATLALSAITAQAAPKTISIEFDGAAYSNFDDGDNHVEGDFRFTAVDPWGGGFVGFGSGAGSCGATYICPSRNGAYYGVVNDGGLRMERTDGGGFSLAGFDAGFLSGVFDPAMFGVVGKLLVQGTGAAGTLNAEFDLLGLDPDTGAGAFAQFDFDGTFSAASFTQVLFTSCIDDGFGSCIAGQSFNLGQFALDSIQVIPEPASLALVGLGLAGAAGARRRRHPKA